MLCIYRVRGNDDLADRFDGVANGGGGRSGLEEDEALLENAVSGMDKVRPRMILFIKLLLHAQYFYFIFLAFYDLTKEYTKSTMMQMCQIWMNVLVLVNSSFYSNNNLGKFPLHSSVYITLKSKISG